MTREIFESNKKIKLINWLNLFKNRIKQEADFFKDLKAGTHDNEFYNLKENFLVRNNINTIQPFSEFTFKDIYSGIYSEFDFKKLNNLEDFKKLRITQMKRLNPKFVLRNHLAQKVIAEAEKGNYDEIDKVLGILVNPFNEHIMHEGEKLYTTSIEKAYSICVSCSS